MAVRIRLASVAVFSTRNTYHRDIVQECIIGLLQEQRRLQDAGEGSKQDAEASRRDSRRGRHPCNKIFLQ